MRKGGHLTLIPGLLAGLALFVAPLAASAQYYAGNNAYQNNRILQHEEHRQWEHAKWEAAHQGVNAYPYGSYAPVATTPLMPIATTPVMPVASAAMMPASIMGSSFQPLNNSSFLSLMPRQESSYIYNAKRQIGQLQNSGQITSQDASMLRSQLKSADRYYQNNNGGSTMWRSQATGYNWNNPLASLAGSGGMYNSGANPYANPAYTGTMGRLRSAFGL